MMMATLNMMCKSVSQSPNPNPQFSHIECFPKSRILIRSPSVYISGDGEYQRRRVRGFRVVSGAAGAGPGPSTTQYIFAFVFPFSLLAITAFTAFRIGDKLDQKFLEELAMNEALREAEEEEDDMNDTEITREEEPALPRTRNRPKREV